MGSCILLVESSSNSYLKSNPCLTILSLGGGGGGGYKLSAENFDLLLLWRKRFQNIDNFLHLDFCFSAT